MKKNSFKLGTYAAMLVAGISVLALGGCEDIEPALDLGGGIKLTDYMQMMQDCEKDNYLKFSDVSGKKSYVTFEGLLKCDPADPDTAMGVWGLSADEKIIDLDGDKFKLILIDDNNMHVRVDSFLQNSSMTLKFKKK